MRFSNTKKKNKKTCQYSTRKCFFLIYTYDASITTIEPQIKKTKNGSDLLTENFSKNVDIFVIDPSVLKFGMLIKNIELFYLYGFFQF